MSFKSLHTLALCLALFRTNRAVVGQPTAKVDEPSVHVSLTIDGREELLEMMYR